MTLYMAVTADKYELPLVVGTLYQVAEYGGVQLKTVQQSISLKRSGKLNGFKYVRVNVEDDDELRQSTQKD